MKTITIFKKSMALAMMLTLAANAFATTYTWNGGPYQYPNGTVILATDIVNMKGDATLHVPTGETLIVMANINGGTFKLTKTGAGALVLTGKNTYGATSISGGEVHVGSNTNTGTLGTGDTYIASGAILRFMRSNEYTYSADITGLGSITKEHNGTTILTGTNSYSGATTVWGGVLQLGTSKTGTGSINFTLIIELKTNATLRFCKDENLFTRNIFGAGKVEVQATVNFTNEMTYTGTTTIGVAGGTSGDLTLGRNGSSKGGLHAGSNVIINNGYLHFDRTDDFSFPNKISGGGSNTYLEKFNPNTISLTGVSDFTGSVYVTSGTLQIGDGTTGGSINNVAGVIVNNPGSKLVFRKPATTITTFPGKISSQGSVEFNCSGYTVYLTGNNTYTGLTTITGGDIYIGAGGTSGDIKGDVLLNGGYFNFHRSDTYTYGGVISGNGGIWKYGAGTTILTGVNTYTGSTWVINGVLQIGDGVTGSINNTYQINLTPISTTTTTGTLRLRNTNSNFNIPIDGGGKVEIHAPDVAFTKDMTYTGTTTIGTTAIISRLHLGAAGTAGNLHENSNVMINNGYLSFSRSNNITFPNKISGAGQLVKNYANKVTLTGANDYTGSTLVQGGTLQIGNGTAGSIANTSGVSLSTATCILRFEPGTGMKFAPKITGAGKVEYSGASSSKSLYLTSNENSYTGGTSILAGALGVGFNGENTGVLPGNVNIAAASHLYFFRSGDYTFSGNITGDGNVHLWSDYSSKLTLTGANTFTGKVEVHEGTLQVGDGTSGTISSSSSAYIEASSVLRFKGTHTYSNEISGYGNLELESGLLYLTYNNTSFTGTTIVENGYFVIGKNTPTGDIKGNIVVNNGSCVHFSRNNSYSYNGVISGTGNVSVNYSPITASSTNGTVTFTKVQQYTGNTRLYGSTLILNIADCIKSSVTVYFMDNASKLDITAANNTLRRISSYNNTITNCEIICGARTLTIGTGLTVADGGGEYWGKITSTDFADLRKTGRETLYLCGDNDYRGKTYIDAGILSVGNNSATGSISNAVVNNGELWFAKTGNYTYPGGISGNGLVGKSGTGTLTLDGTLAYTGATKVTDGTLILGMNRHINASSEVYLANTGTPKIDVSSTSGTARVFKTLNGNNANAEVILGASTLTIGEDGEPNGGGVFTGKFTGLTGALTKKGTATLTLSGTHQPTGNFSQQDGSVNFAGEWKGKYVKNSVGNLDIVGNVTFGNLDLYGGTISMNLTATTPSKINVGGLVTSYGVTNLNLTAPEVIPPAYKVLINATGGGIPDATKFTVTPSTCTLDGSFPNQLWLASNMADNIAPTAGASGVINGTAYVESADLTWTEATDIPTPPANLRYYVYRSLNNNISTPATCTLNGTLLNSGGTLDIAAYTATGLTPNTTYYFNVVVEDQAANQTAYVTKSLTTEKATLTGAPTITGSELVTQTLTANLAGVTSTPVPVALGITGTEWKRNGTTVQMGGLTYTLVEADYGQQITVTVTASNCLGNVTSAPTGTIGKAALTGTPVITGQAILGLTLTAGTGTLAPAAPVTVLGALSSYQWQRNGVDIPGATSSIYELETADVGQTITVSVTASNCIGSQTSLPTATVTKAMLTGTLTVEGQTVMGMTLTAETSALTSIPTIPSIGALSYQWQRFGMDIDGATSSTYVLTAADVGNIISVLITAENCIGQLGAAATGLVTKAMLTGTPTITGAAVFGETLTAVTTSLSSTPVVALGELSYQWKRGGVDIPGASAATYELVEADLGQTITVVMTAENCDGIATSASTAVVIKASQTAPAAPTMESKTSTSITLDVIPGCEYRIDGGAWQTSPEFTDLEPDTEYSFEAYKPETDTHFASPVSELVNHSTGGETAIEEVVLPNLVIYPNPCVNSVVIEGANNYLLKITTTEGLVIHSEEIISNQQKIQVNDLPKGVYLFCLVKDGTMMGKKVVKE